MNIERELNDKLFNKMNSEFEKYKEKLVETISKDPRAIFTNAYELIYKEDTLSVFEDKDFQLPCLDARALLSKKYPLDYLYQEWLDCDITYMDKIRDSIQMAVDDNTKHFVEKQKDSHER